MPLGQASYISEIFDLNLIFDVSLTQFGTFLRLKITNTAAEIVSVSPQIGSTEGGTRVVVTGRHFDETTEPVKILIGGVPCHVISGTSTATKVECLAGKPPTKKEYYTGICSIQ